MPALAKYARAVLVYNLAVILWGAVVRASGSGAGCGGHWPLCNGSVVPLRPTTATLIEYSHRLTSGIVLLLAVGLVVWAFRAAPKGHPVRRGAALVLLFTLTEAAVGAGLVLFELVAQDRSLARALFIATHLGNTLVLLACLALTVHWASGGERPRLRADSLTASFALGFLGLLASGASGAVAALGDTLFPAASLTEALRQDASATAHLLIRLRAIHPLVAGGAGVYLIFLCYRTIERRRTPAIRSAANRVLLLVFVQWLIGFANIALLAPLWVQLPHLLVADLLWIALVVFAVKALAAAADEVPVGLAAARA